MAQVSSRPAEAPTTSSEIDGFARFCGPLPDAMLLVTAEGAILRCNGAAQRLLGERAGSRLQELAPDSAEAVQQQLSVWASAKGEELRSGAFRIRAAGVAVDCEVDGAPVRAGSEEALLLVRIRPLAAGPCVNASASHFAALNESLRVTMANISDAVIAADPEGHVTFLNPVAEQLTGWASGEAMGRPVHEVVRILHEQTRQPATEQIRRILRGQGEGQGQGQGQGQTSDELAPYTILVTHDGTERPIENTAAQVCDAAGAVTGAVLILHDCGPSREAERLGKELLLREHAIREQAEHANQIKDEFLAVLSHELRTPLSAITGWVQLLQQQQLGAEQVARGLEVIERNVRAQTQLINDLLDVSRILSGKLSLDYRPVELVSVIFTAIDSVELTASKKGLSLRAHLDKEASLVQGDSIRLQQVIWNLLQNSIKFTPSGGWIEVRLERDGAFVRVTVKDSGAGIAPEFLPSLFERFHQADSTITRRHGGLGLGLALVREIIELHGGTVMAESPGIDKGTTITLQIPQRTAPLVKSERPKNRTKISAPSLIPPNQLAGLNILLVEDDPDSREIIRFAMQSYGADVREASSVAEAKEQLRQRVPDVLVSDIGLPEEDGFALIRYVRKLRPSQGGKVPALALTAFARHVDAERAISEGFHQHLAKPAPPATLVEVVAQLAGRG